MVSFFAITFAQRTPHGQRQTVQHEEYNVHLYMRLDGLCGVITADMEYPPRVAFSLLAKMLDEFSTAFPDWATVNTPKSLSFDFINEGIANYQDPANADSITRIQRDLDDTVQILHSTIDSVLERGERLEELVDRSETLSAQSKMFYKQARKTNSCCAVA